MSLWVKKRRFRFHSSCALYHRERPQQQLSDRPKCQHATFDNSGEPGSCANMPGPGGSRRGIPNRRTLYKQSKERAAALMKIDGADFVGENLNAMGEALGFFLQMAREEANQRKNVSTITMC